MTSQRCQIQKQTIESRVSITGPYAHIFDDQAIARNAQFTQIYLSIKRPQKGCISSWGQDARCVMKTHSQHFPNRKDESMNMYQERV